MTICERCGADFTGWPRGIPLEHYLAGGSCRLRQERRAIAIATARAGAPKCMVEGCPFRSTTRIVNREQNPISRRTWLLCDDCYNSRHNIDELFDGRLVRRLLGIGR